LRPPRARHTERSDNHRLRTCIASSIPRWSLLVVVVEIGVGDERFVSGVLIDVASDAPLAVAVVGVAYKLIPEVLADLGVEPSSLGELGFRIEGR